MRWGFGAGVDRKNHAPFEERFGFPLVEAWAMTETGAAACVMANHEPRHVGTSCFGRPEPFVEVRLVDDEGRDVPAGAPGELLVRSAGADPRRHFFSRLPEGRGGDRRRPGQAAGSTPATWCGATATAACTSSTARRT